MYEDIDPLLHDMLGDFNPQPPPEAYDIHKFFSELNVPSSDLPGDDAFAKAHSPQHFAHLVKAANPAYSLTNPMRKFVNRPRREDTPREEDYEFTHEEEAARLTKRAAAEESIADLRHLESAVNLSKRSGVAPSTGSIQSQIAKLAAHMRGFLSAEQVTLVEKALRALDFTCILQIFNDALQEVA